MLCCTQAVIQTMSPGRAPISYANAPRGSDFWKTSAKAHLKMRAKLVLSRVAGELLAPCVNNRRGFSLPVGSYHSRRAPLEAYISAFFALDPSTARAGEGPAGSGVQPAPQVGAAQASSHRLGDDESGDLSLWSQNQHSSHAMLGAAIGAGPDPPT